MRCRRSYRRALRNARPLRERGRTTMLRTLVSLAAVVTVLSGTTAVSADGTFKSALHDYRVVTVVDGLVQPWSSAFLPGGDMLITERPGRLRIVRQGTMQPPPVEDGLKVFDSSPRVSLE